MDGETEISVARAVSEVRLRWPGRAETAVILGSGLGDLADEVDADAIIAYRDIPGFPHSTALAHKGRLVCGTLAGRPVMMMQGRCHLYEGYPLADITLPTRVLCALGIRRLVVTNAAGGVNPSFLVGDVMLIEDHVNLMWLGGTWPLDPAAPGRVSRPQPRLYDEALANQALAIARREDFPLQRGVYIALTGPSYETRAEYRAFRRLGGDCVGMSTVPEVLVAAAAGVQVLGLSTVTNVACPDAPQKVSADEVVEVGKLALPKVRAIVRGILTAT